MRRRVIVPDAFTYSAAISVRVGPATPAGLTSPPSDAAPCHRASCGHLWLSIPACRYTRIALACPRHGLEGHAVEVGKVISYELICCDQGSCEYHRFKSHRAPGGHGGEGRGRGGRSRRRLGPASVPPTAPPVGLGPTGGPSRGVRSSPVLAGPDPPLAAKKNISSLSSSLCACACACACA